MSQPISSSPRRRRTRATKRETTAAANAALRASRALVAVAARSLSGLGDITLSQYRALVVLAQQGPMRAGDLADALGVHPSTLTRLADRLVQRGLVERRTAEKSRREVEIELAPDGRQLVDDVTRRRVDDLLRILGAVDREVQLTILEGLEAFADAAGEAADEWTIPWS